MKKILLSLLCLVGFIAANAEKVAFVADGASYSGTATTKVTVANGAAGNIVGLSFTSDDITLAHTKKVNSSYSQVNSNAVRWYQGDILTVTPASGVTVTEIKACIASGSKGAFSTSAEGTVSGAGTLANSFVTWTGSCDKAFELTAVKQVRFSYMEITYTKGVATNVSTPVIKPNGGEISADTEITIECATEGASIYYTIDGTEPSTSSTLYTAPFTLSAAATVKAIAVAEGLENSDVTEAVFTFPESVANIGEFLAKANTSKAYTIEGPVTVVAQSGSYLFLQDATGKIVAFGNLSNTYNNGDQLTNIKGTYTLYNGLPEMNVVASSFGTPTAGAAVAPEKIALEEVAIDNLLAYVKITGVKIDAATDSYGKSFPISDETGNATMYNSAGIDVPTGENKTIIGFISCYNTTVQILPVEITSASGLEIVEAPVIAPNGGAIATNQEITITCGTEGASIYYTLDGTEPTTSSTLYEGAFTLAEECTVKAIAVAEGMEQSAVVEAAFTFLSDDIKVATFDFTNPASLNPTQEKPATGAEISVNDIKFTSDVVTLVAAQNSGSNTCRLWGKTDGTSELRTYSSSTITISATNANITSIEFDGGKASATQMTADSGELTGKVWTATDSVSTVVFTAKATTNITTITVNYEPTETGVEEIEVDNNAAVEYYNLQGVKVANPANGFFIKVQGTKASKVYVK